MSSTSTTGTTGSQANAIVTPSGLNSCKPKQGHSAFAIAPIALFATAFAGLGYIEYKYRTITKAVVFLAQTLTITHVVLGVLGFLVLYAILSSIYGKKQSEQSGSISLSAADQDVATIDPAALEQALAADDTYTRLREVLEEANSRKQTLQDAFESIKAEHDIAKTANEATSVQWQASLNTNGFNHSQTVRLRAAMDVQNQQMTAILARMSIAEKSYNRANSDVMRVKMRIETRTEFIRQQLLNS